MYVGYRVVSCLRADHSFRVSVWLRYSPDHLAQCGGDEVAAKENILGVGQRLKEVLSAERYAALRKKNQSPGVTFTSHYFEGPKKDRQKITL